MFLNVSARVIRLRLTLGTSSPFCYQTFRRPMMVSRQGQNLRTRHRDALSSKFAVEHHDQAASASLIARPRGVDSCLCSLHRTNPLLLLLLDESTPLRSSGLCFLDRMNPLLARRVSIFSRCARIFIFFSGWVVHHD
jgi:hypothetical protein